LNNTSGIIFEKKNCFSKTLFDFVIFFYFGFGALLDRTNEPGIARNTQ